MAKPTEEQIARFSKIMGDPILPAPSEELSRTRFRLLLVGSLSLAIGAWNLKIGAESTILGLKIENLTDSVVRTGLCAVLAYLLLHFLWAVADAFVEWRLRLTGYEESFSLGQETFPREKHRTAQQATLHSWWASEARRIDDTLNSAVEGVNAELAKWRQATGAAPPKDMQDALKRLIDCSERMTGTLASAQLWTSLRRFDAWFRHFIYSQNLRWFVFDLVLPFVVGLAGLIALLRPVWSRMLSAV